MSAEGKSCIVCYRNDPFIVRIQNEGHWFRRDDHSKPLILVSAHGSDIEASEAWIYELVDSLCGRVARYQYTWCLAEAVGVVAPAVGAVLASAQAVKRC